MATKKKIKAKGFIFIGIIIIFIVGAITVYKHIEYINSNTYFLLEKGYSESEVETILKNKKMTSILLKRDYNKYIINIMLEKYYLEKNLNAYIKYKEEHEDENYKDIIAKINVGADKKWYEYIKPADTSKDILMLVNKIYYLEEDYELSDLVTMSIQYAFDGKTVRDVADKAFQTLSLEARDEGLKIVANSTFRDYKYQDSLYKGYRNSKGQKYADSYAARPGHSEHQTGLAIDVSTLKSTLEDFEKTKEFTWLQENAHKYGFILRYPKGKEHLTGYNYESWHYRYVGVDTATKIKDEDLTFDEYYAYYLDK